MLSDIPMASKYLVGGAAGLVSYIAGNYYFGKLALEKDIDFIMYNFYDLC